MGFSSCKFCKGGVKKMRFIRVHFLNPKGGTFGGGAALPQKKIDPGYGPDRLGLGLRMLEVHTEHVHNCKLVRVSSAGGGGVGYSGSGVRPEP